MVLSCLVSSCTSVALLAEGVDRNVLVARRVKMAFRSPSSRRAWIEINLCEGCSNLTSCRPPRGGRG